MKIKEGFVLRTVGDNSIVIALGENAKKFNAMISLNDVGAFLWKQLEKGADEDGLVKALLDEYEVTEEIAKDGVKKFVKKLQEGELLD